MIELAYPEVQVPGFSGSNNWAISGELSASSYPMLATDPSTAFDSEYVFYVHLHVKLGCVRRSFPGYCTLVHDGFLTTMLLGD